MNEKSQYLLYGLDITKFVMAIFVIAIHTQPFMNNGNAVLKQFFEVLTGMAVPFFFISSGYLLMRKIQNSDRSELEVISTYIKRMLRLYLTWSVIYLPLAVAGLRGGYSILKFSLVYIKDFVFVGQHYNSWMLWYLLSTIYSAISIFLLRKANVKLIMILVISGVIFGGSIAIDIFRATSHTTPLMITVDYLLKNTLGNGRLLRGFFYITLGMFMCSKKLFFKNYLFVAVFFISFIASIILGDEVSCTILLIPCVWGVFGVVVKLQGFVNSRWAVLRKMSTEMYFIHLWVWTIYYMLVYGNKTYGFDSFLVTTVVSILVSAFIVFVLKDHRQVAPIAPEDLS